jgi:hypothetical protein
MSLLPGKAFSKLLQGEEGFKTPDVTRTTVIALGQAIVAVLVVFGFDVDDDTQQLILALSGALAVVLPLSDAVIRSGRARNADKIAVAQAEAAKADDGLALTAEERQRLWELRRRLQRGPR